MGKGENYVNVLCMSAVSEGLIKAMPQSEATGVVFVAWSHCGSVKTV